MWAMQSLTRVERGLLEREAHCCGEEMRVIDYVKIKLVIKACALWPMHHGHIQVAPTWSHSSFWLRLFSSFARFEAMGYCYQVCEGHELQTLVFWLLEFAQLPTSYRASTRQCKLQKVQFENVIMIPTDYGTTKYNKLRSNEEKTAYVSTRVSFHDSYNTWRTHPLPVDDTRFSIAHIHYFNSSHLWLAAWIPALRTPSTSWTPALRTPSIEATCDPSPTNRPSSS